MRKTVLKIALLVVLTPVLCQATSIDFYDDGTIQNGHEYTVANVWNTATVNMEGGQVGQFIAHNSSTINFYGGTVASISLQNASIFNLEGILLCDDFGMGHSSTLNVNSGTFDGTIRGSGNRISINEGTLNITESIITNYTITNIYGGNVTFYDILFDRYSILNVYGGEVIFNRDSFGDAFRLSATAGFNVYYSDIIYGDSGTDIIGYHLLDGNAFMLDQFTQSEIDLINFVPEPATLLLLALGGLIVRTRKQ